MRSWMLLLLVIMLSLPPGIAAFTLSPEHGSGIDPIPEDMPPDHVKWSDLCVHTSSGNENFHARSPEACNNDGGQKTACYLCQALYDISCTRNMTLGSRDPIVIGSNSDLNVLNGVRSGNGSSDDPYIIGGWMINATGTGSGISIRNVTAFVLVDNCTLTGDQVNGSDTTGISILNSSHVQVNACTITDCGIGILTANAGHCGIGNSTLDTDSIGCYIHDSVSCTVTDLWVHNCSSGVAFAAGCDNCTVSHCSIFHILAKKGGGDGTGIDVQNHCDNCRILDNNISATDADAISILEGCTGTFVAGNLCLDARDSGIHMNGGTSATISGNECGGCSKMGIYAEHESGDSIIGNSCSGNWFGIWCTDVAGGSLSSNTCSLSYHDGIHAISVNDLVISSNVCSNCSGNGIYISEGGYGVKLLNDTCTGNQLSGIEVNTVLQPVISSGTFMDNYRGLWLSTCTATRVTGCHMGLNTYGAVVDACSGALLRDNILQCNSEGVVLDRDTDSCILFNNSFLNNSYQADDHGSHNNFYDTVCLRGNYWSDYTLRYVPGSTHDRNVWSRPYTLSDEAEMSDEYPLVRPPGMKGMELSPGVEGSPAFGVGISLTCTAHNVSLPWQATLLYWFDDGNGTAPAIWTELAGAPSCSSTVRMDVNIPSGTQGDHLNYQFYTFTSFPLYSPVRTLTVKDSTPPVFGEDHAPATASVNSTVAMMIDVSDNREISLVALEYWYLNGHHGELAMIPRNGSWYVDLKLSNTIGILHYRYNATDTSGNHIASTVRDINVVDDQFPCFGEELTPSGATTGDPFTFSTGVSDNVALATVEVEYYFTTGNVMCHSLRGNGTFTHTITVPSTSTASLYYRFHAVDTTGNSIYTPLNAIPVSDNDPPTPYHAENISVTAPAETLLDASGCTDNIGISLYRWSFVYDSVNMILFGPAPEFNLTIPGHYHILLTLGDDACNTASAELWITVLPGPEVELAVSLGVEDTDGVPIEGVTVVLRALNTTLTSITDANGSASFRLPGGMCGQVLTITMSMEGYGTVVYHPALLENDTLSDGPPPMRKMSVVGEKEGTGPWGVVVFFMILLILVITGYMLAREYSGRRREDVEVDEEEMAREMEEMVVDAEEIPGEEIPGEEIPGEEIPGEEIPILLKEEEGASVLPEDGEPR